MNEDELKKWHSLLKNHEAMCYIKPTRHIHESGYRTFEVGYCTLNNKNKVEDKVVLTEYSDHVCLDYYTILIDKTPISLNMDLTLDGHIRLWTHKEIIHWKFDDGLSSMMIGILK